MRLNEDRDATRDFEQMIRTHYDGADYTDDTRVVEERVFRKLRAYLFGHCPEASRVVEFAIADGKNLPYYPRGCEVHGVDLSPRQLSAASSKAAELGVPFASYASNVHTVQLEERSFDAAVCTLGLCTIPQPERAIEKMRRLVKPGGRLLFLEHVYPQRSLLGRIFCKCVCAPVASKKMPGCDPTRDTIKSVEDAGLEIVARREVFGGILAAFVAVDRASPRA